MHARGLLSATLICVLVPSPFQAQSAQDQSPPQQTQQGGNATGGTFAAVYDAEKRPITAGGFVDSGTVVFEDVTKSAGLAGWSHTMGSPEKKFIIDTDGSGVGLIDYDNDGWLDIYMVNGSTFDALDGKQSPPHAALFHNNHDGTFTDVTDKAGVGYPCWAMGASVGDYNDDGLPDLLVTCFGGVVLYRNNGDGTFTDVTKDAGLSGDHMWATGAAFGD